MSLNIGKKPSAPSYGAITPYNPKDSVDNLTATRTGITIGEIVLILASVFTLGAGTPAAIGAEIGIGLAAGAANEGLDVSTGQGSVGGAFINFAPALIPGITGPVGNFLKTTKAIKSATTVKEFSNTIINNAEAAGKEANAIINAGQTLGQKLSGKALQLPTENINKFIPAVSELYKSIGVENPFATSFTKKLTNAFTSETKALTVGKSGLKVSDNVSRSTKELVGENDSYIRKFFKGLSELSAIDNLSYDFLEETLNRRTTIADLLDKLSLYNEILSDDIQELFATFRSELAQVQIGGRQIERELQASLFLDILRRDSHRQTFIKYYEATKQESRLKAFFGLLRRPGSKEFNDKWVQKVQAFFDPNDLGRAPVEWTYKKIRAKLETMIRKYFSKAENLLDKAEDLDDLFEKTGGIVLPHSDWIRGFKVLDAGNDILEDAEKIRSFILNPLAANSSQMVMFSFKGTARRHGPVVAFVSSSILRKMILPTSDPGHYYIKYVALAKNGPGGKKNSIDQLFAGLSGVNKVFGEFVRAPGLSRVFSFLNINAIRNIYSLVSNVVENSSSLVKGTYGATYFKKLSRSFTNTLVSRSLRLVSAGALKPTLAAGLKSKFAHSLSDIFSRELQKFNTLFVTKGLKNVIAGESYTKGINSTTILNSFTSSVKSQTLKYGYRKRYGGTINVLKYQRNLKIITAAPNTFTPGRKYGLKKFGKF